MKAIVVTCPHCGARLKVAGTLIEVRCEYCGTASRIQKRTRIMDRVLPPPPVTPGHPVQIAVQRRGYLLLLLLLPGLLIAPIAAAIVASRSSSTVAPVQRRSVPPTRSPFDARVAAEEPSSWLGTDSAILVDLDGDGTLDIIGRARRSRPDSVSIVALDGATGAPRWESESLGTYTDVYTRQLALAGELLVFASSSGAIRAFGVADGKSRWTTQLDERVTAFCDGGDFVIAIGADKVERRLVLADGAAVDTPAEQPPAASRGKRRSPAKPTCTALPGDKARHGWTVEERALGRRHDISSERLTRGPGGAVLSGTRRTGTHVPTLVALDETSKERWRIAIPPDPLGAAERAPGQVVVGDDTVCAVYEISDDKRKLGATCFAMTDGRRLWHERLTSHYASALLVAGKLLLISMSGNLEARELQTGAVRWRFDR